MFAVFGNCRAMSYEHAAKRAGKYSCEGELGVLLTQKEWEAKVAKLADDHFENSRPTQISIIYASKREAMQFKKLMEVSGEGKNLVIRKRQNPGGGAVVIHTKSKKPILEWASA